MVNLTVRIQASNNRILTLESEDVPFEFQVKGEGAVLDVNLDRSATLTLSGLERKDVDAIRAHFRTKGITILAEDLWE